MYTCASCTLRSCQKGGGDLPRNCPMRDPEFFDRLLERYWSEENHDFFVTSAAIESAGYWPLAPPEGDRGVLPIHALSKAGSGFLCGTEEGGRCGGAGPAE